MRLLRRAVLATERRWKAGQLGQAGAARGNVMQSGPNRGGPDDRFAMAADLILSVERNVERVAPET